MFPEDNSTNNQPPALGPGYPTYPELPQILRVSGGKVFASWAGVWVTPAYTQQFVPPLSLRDREPCWVVEPNNVDLKVGTYYDCRLVGSFTQTGAEADALPLYATTCCPT